MLGDARRALTRRRHPAPSGSFSRIEPVSRVFGLDRGVPIDRHYIERFLARQAGSIRGRVLEVGDDRYTRRFGADAFEDSRVLRTVPDDDPGTLVGDLTDPGTLPEAAFDCFVCTQTLNFVFPLHEAVESIHRLLAPGGVLLATVAGISQISRYDQERWGDYWRFTPRSLEALLLPVFGGGVTVEAHGNLLAATALLQGLAVEDLPEATLLDEHDPDYPVTIAAVARRSP
jgi:SAM-dependent methyltransferase